MVCKIIKNYFLLLLFVFSNVYATKVLLNSSYDLSRELFTSFNLMFIKEWELKHPEDKLLIRQSHAASTKQAMSVLHGLRADVVTYNQISDVQMLYDHGRLIPIDWQQRFPNNSSPFYSTIVFFVRQNNPKGIFDWDDLIRDNVTLIFSNPKVSGSGRYVYLAAWGVFSQKYKGDKEMIHSSMSKFLKNVKVFDIGGRSATTTFFERNQGDVLMTFESEMYNVINRYNVRDYDLIMPKCSILVEFPVTWIDKNVNKNDTKEIAIAYLNYLYSKDAQKMIANFYYRVNSTSIMNKNKNKFPEINLFKVEDYFGSWQSVMDVHFSCNGELDKLLRM